MRALPLVLLAFAVAGCDALFSPETAVHVTGRVVEAGTGDPIPGIVVYVCRCAGLVTVPRAEARTGPDGRFSLAHDDGEDPTSFRFLVNADPHYRPGYSSFYGRVVRGEAKDFGDIALERIDP